MSKMLAVFFSFLTIAACSSQPTTDQNAAGVEDRKPAAVGAETQSVATNKLDEYSMEMLKNPKSILSKRSVYFDFDQYIIKEEFKPLLEAHGHFLAANGKVKMLLQGNADERGSREYNLALGQKRAEAVKKTLLLLGGKEDQIESVSLGKEKPRCSEHTEACWAENRRGDMLYTGEF